MYIGYCLENTCITIKSYMYSFDVPSLEKGIHLYSKMTPQTETRNVHVCSLRHSVATQRPTAIK